MAADLHDSIAALGSDLRAELKAIDDLRDGREATRQLAIDDLLLRQVDDARSQESHRVWVRKYVLAPIVVVATSGGGLYGAHTWSRPPEVRVSDVKAQVLVSRTELAQRVGQLESELQYNRSILVRLVEMLQDQHVHVSDAVFYIEGKLDRISPRSRRQKLPDTVREGRQGSWKIKQSRTPFEGYDPANPMADIHKGRRYGAK